MAVTYKDISQLTQKATVAGTEKLPVSDTEYITPSQIAELVDINTLNTLLNKVAYNVQTIIDNLASTAYIGTVPTYEDMGVTWSVTTTLTNCTMAESISDVIKNGSYLNTVIPDTGYELGTATITMGGVDITSQCYNSATGEVSIASVTGNIVITAVATENSGWVSGVPYDMSGYTDNKYLSNGVETTYNGWAISPFLPTRGAFIVSDTAFTRQYCAYYDSQQAYVGTIAVPANAAPISPRGDYLRVSDTRSKVSGATITPYRLDVITESTTPTTGKWYTYTPITGKYVDNTNGQEKSGAYDCSDYLNCSGMSTVLINQQAGSWGSVVFFDGNKDYISGETKTNQSSWATAVTVPSGAKYVRISGETGINLAIKYE